MIDFENPAAFFLLLLVPALYVLRSMKVFVPVSFPLTLGDWHGAHFHWGSRFAAGADALCRLLLVAAFVCVVAAFAGPVVRHQERVYSSRGTDILYVVDTSPSMASKDIAGLTRLEAAKQAIKTLETQRGGDSVGLVAMAREAAIVVPPTMDRPLFFDRLDGLLVGELGDGTALGIGLSCAILHLESSRAPRKCIVLITDGENNSGEVHPHTAAHLARDKHISLYVLGIGTRGAVPLEYTDPKTGRLVSGYLESHYDAAALSQVALEAGGKFYEIPTMSALSQALDVVGKNENVVQNYYMKNSDEYYYGVFLLAAGVLSVLAFFIRRICLQEVL